VIFISALLFFLLSSHILDAVMQLLVGQSQSPRGEIAFMTSQETIRSRG